MKHCPGFTTKGRYLLQTESQGERGGGRERERSEISNLRAIFFKNVTVETFSQSNNDNGDLNCTHY